LGAGRGKQRGRWRQTIRSLRRRRRRRRRKRRVVVVVVVVVVGGMFVEEPYFNL
jgi:hypothetical protein